MSLLGSEGTASGQQQLLAGSTCSSGSRVINHRADCPLDGREILVPLGGELLEQARALGFGCSGAAVSDELSAGRTEPALMAGET